MNEFLVLTRAIHFGAVLWLFGEFVFLPSWSGPPCRAFRRMHPPTATSTSRRLFRVAGCCVAIGIASAIAWLLLEAASMSGTPIAVAFNRQTLDVVVGETLFGRIWLVRFGLSLVLSAALWFAWREPGRPGSILKIGGTLLAGAYAATLAWTGHATGDMGADRYIHLTSDAVHLLAAGASVGALPALISLLKRAGRVARPEAFALAVSVTRRFSTLGIGQCEHVGGDRPGQRLVPRWQCSGAAGQRLRPALAVEASALRADGHPGGDQSPASDAAARARQLQRSIGTPSRNALARLRRNTLLEMAAGVAIVGIVAALGLTTPAAHMLHHERPHSMTSEGRVH